LSVAWPSPVAGRRGKKLAVVRRELVVYPFPLSQEEVAHDLVALGERVGFELVERRVLLEGVGVELRNVNTVQFGDAFGLGVVVDALDHDAQAAHGYPP
jgi:hypothetical protein